MASNPVQRLLGRLEKVKAAGDGWTARCPGHDDDSPSLSVDGGADGRALVNCYAGCATEDVVAAVGLELSDLYPTDNGPRPRRGFTAEDYGTYLEIPAQYLRAQFGVRTAREAGKSATVATPYRDAGGTTIRTRHRTRDKFWWASDGDGVALYALDRLADADPSRSVLVVEGESDVHVCARHEMLAVGVPGASSWRSSWARHLEGRDVYVWREPDQGGETLVADVADDLPRARVLDGAAAFGVDDPSDLHRMDPDRFRDRMRELVREARPIREVVAGGGAADPPDNPGDAADPPRRSLVGTFLSNVEPEAVRWLWPGRIPLGKLTMLDGDPGLMKSVLMLDLAARLSVGADMPDGASPDLDGPAGTVLLTAEDGLADTIRPRLDAAGADASRILSLDGIQVETPDGDPPDVLAPTVEDVREIEEAVRLVDARLIVVDPLVAYVDDDRNTHTDASVRRALVGLARLADDLGVAVGAVRHLTKGGSDNPKYRGGGSIAFIAAARSGMLVAEDPDAPETRRVLAMTKANLCAPPPSLAFRAEPVETDSGVRSIRVAWEGESDHAATDLLDRPSGEERTSREEAADILRVELRDGPRPVSELQDVADRLGVSWRTVQRAARSIDVEKNRVGGLGADGRWVWSLPDPPSTQADALGGRDGREAGRDKGSTKTTGGGVALGDGQPSPTDSEGSDPYPDSDPSTGGEEDFQTSLDSTLGGQP